MVMREVIRQSEDNFINYTSDKVNLDVCFLADDEFRIKQAFKFVRRSGVRSL